MNKIKNLDSWTLKTALSSSAGQSSDRTGGGGKCPPEVCSTECTTDAQRQETCCDATDPSNHTRRAAGSGGGFTCGRSTGGRERSCRLLAGGNALRLAWPPQLAARVDVSPTKLRVVTLLSVGV